MKRTSLFGHIIEVCDAIHAGSRPADIVVRDFFRDRRYLGARDRRYISEAVYGLLRNNVLLDLYARESFLAAHSDRIPDKMPAVVLLCIFLVRLGGESCDTILPDISGLWRVYVPDLTCEAFLAVVSNVQLPASIEQDPPGRLAVLYSLPLLIVREWMERFGPVETELLCRSLNQPAPTTIRVNTHATTVDHCRELLLRDSVESVPGVLAPTALTLQKRVNIQALQAFKLGYFEMQDEGSQLLSLLVGAQPGATIVDACAGGGGKTLHLAAIMQNNGTLLAIDVHEFRLRNIRERIHRAGVTIADLLLVGRDDERIALWEGKSDAVLIDAPCTGVGTFRRNPGARLTFTDAFLSQVATTQRDVLDRYARFVKPGGRLVYSTCTLTQRENENQIATFLERHPEFTLTSAPEILRGQGIHIDSTGEYLLLLPHRTGTDGFFAAVMTRSFIDS